MMNCWPSNSPMRGAMLRDKKSPVPPGAKGTTMRMGLLG